MLKNTLSAALALGLSVASFGAAAELISASATTVVGNFATGGTSCNRQACAGPAGVKYDIAVKGSYPVQKVEVWHTSSDDTSSAFWNTKSLIKDKSLPGNNAIWVMDSEFDFNRPFWGSGNHALFTEFKHFKIVYHYQDGGVSVDDNDGEYYSMAAPERCYSNGVMSCYDPGITIKHINGDVYEAETTQAVSNIAECGSDRMNLRDRNFWSNGYDMECVGGSWLVNVPSGTDNAQFWTKDQGIGDSNYDGLAQASETADSLYIPDHKAGDKQAYRYNMFTKDYDVLENAELKRTVVYIYGETQNGQDMFLRGGLDHDYANSNLGRNCSTSNFECALPIEFVNFKNGTTAPWKASDTHLDWYGSEANQSDESQGSAMDWTTNEWPSDWGTTPYYDAVGYGQDPENTFGMHFWKLDVVMDCSKAVDGWFEVKSYISNGPGWEGAIDQGTSHGEPYASGNHFAQCGKKNVFFRDWVEVSGKGWRGPNDVIFEEL